MKVDLTARPVGELGLSLGLETNQMVSSLARQLAPLSIDASIPRAIETLRHSNLGAYPVVNGSRLALMLTEDELGAALLALPSDDYESYRKLPLSSVVDPLLISRQPCRFLYSMSPLSVAAELFKECPDVSVVPVLDQSGFYTGVLSRSDVLAIRFKTLAPSRVGGMATPLGVYLTDGIDAGGVGNVALMLAGATLTSLFAVAVIALHLVDNFALLHHVDVWGQLATVLMPIMPRLAMTVVDNLEELLPLIIMMLFLRPIPVAGYHAAEHQVVHCMERGEPLIYEKVVSMPRPHPRCGTNLVAAVTLIGIYFSVFSGLIDPPTAVVIAAIFTLLTWRQVGTFLQQHVTTRKASAKQIASGIAAGEDLLSKFRSNTNRRVKLPMRIWRMGFIQMFGGVAIVAGILWCIRSFVPQLQPYLQGIN